MTKTNDNIDITTLPIEYWEIEKLKPYEFNNKIHKPQQIEALSKSIKENGIENPLLIEEDGTIISGHGRLMAAQALDYKFIPVRVAVGINNIQAKKLRISVNKTTSTQYDNNNLSLELADLKNLDIDLNDIGLTDKEIDILSAKIEPISFDDIAIEIPQEKLKGNNTANDVEKIDEQKITITKALKTQHITIAEARILSDYILLLEDRTGLSGIQALISHANEVLING